LALPPHAHLGVDLDVDLGRAADLGGEQLAVLLERVRGRGRGRVKGSG